MNDLDTLYTQWNAATANLKWGVQKVFRDVFKAAQDGQTTLVYGADYRNGGACLVNTVGVMLTTGGGPGIPTEHYGEVVSLFDQINEELYQAGVNIDHGLVSPLAADIFLMHFAPEKETPSNTPDLTKGSIAQGMEPDMGPYREPTDEEMAKALAEMFIQTDVPTEIKLGENVDVQVFSVEPIDENA